jgi:hypothetical protein
MSLRAQRQLTNEKMSTASTYLGVTPSFKTKLNAHSMCAQE